MKSRGHDQAPTPVVLAHSATFSIGGLEVRPATREVVGPGGRDVIEPRIMQVLVALHDAGGEIVSRDDLIGCCWDGRAVGDDAINRVISRLRRVGETIGGDAYRIETITKVGYRLVAGQGGSATGAPTPRASSAISRRMLIGGGLATVAAVGGLYWVRREDAIATSSPEARDHYLRGEALFDATARWPEAANSYQRAVEADPEFAQAWGRLALTLEFGRFFEPAERGDMLGLRAREAAQRALALDPRNSSALTAQAMSGPMYGDWLTVETRLREALASNPEEAPARDMLARLLENVGRTRDAISAIEAYPELFRDRLQVQFRLAVWLWSAGRLTDADRVIDSAMGRWPTDYAVWFTRYWIYVRSGRPQRALEMSARLQRPSNIPPSDFELNDLAARAMLTRMPADVQRATAAYRQASARGAGYCENGMHLAGQLGLVDEAFALAEAYYFGRGFRVASSRFQTTGAFTPPYRRFTGLLFAPTTASMRADPRFGPLMEETGLASYWRRSGTRADVLA